MMAGNLVDSLDPESLCNCAELLKDIPDITNDMDDLANSVIASQEKIADILSKQKDEYIENLKEEVQEIREEEIKLAK